MAGSRICSPCLLVGDTVTTTAGRRTGSAVHPCRRQRLHPRAVADPRRRGRSAAQCASRCDEHAAAEQPVRDRSVVAPGARGGPTARRRSPGPAAGRAARLPLRAQPARPRARRGHSAHARAGAAGRSHLDNSTTPMEAIAANNVVDGLVLAQMWQDNPGRAGSHAAQRLFTAADGRPAGDASATNSTRSATRSTG